MAYKAHIQFDEIMGAAQQVQLEQALEKFRKMPELQELTILVNGIASSKAVDQLSHTLASFAKEKPEIAIHLVSDGIFTIRDTTLAMLHEVENIQPQFNGIFTIKHTPPTLATEKHVELTGSIGAGQLKRWNETLKSLKIPYVFSLEDDSATYELTLTRKPGNADTALKNHAASTHHECNHQIAA